MKIRSLRTRRWFPLILGIWIESTVSAGAGEEQAVFTNVGMEPLSIQFLSVGQLFQPDPIIHFPSSHIPGAWRADLSWYWGNIWNYDATGEGFLIDGEWIHLSLTLSRRFGPRAVAGIGVPAIGRTGGFADSFIEDFHDAFGFDNDHRDEFPRDRVRVEFTDDHGEPRRIAGDSWGIGDVFLFGSWTAMPGDADHPTIDLFATVSAPSGDENELQGMGGVSLGAGGRLARRLGGGDWYGYLVARGLYVFADEILGVEIHSLRATGIAALERRLGPRTSLLLQGAVLSPAARHFPAFSDPVFEVSVGAKWAVGKASRLELSLVENIVTFNNSVDFAAHAAWTTGF